MPEALIGRNLIVNPGAELGPSATGYGGSDWVTPQGWTGDPLLTSVLYSIGGPSELNAANSAAIAGGLSYFAGGPGSANPVVTQTISLAAFAAAIDAGGTLLDLSGWFGGYLSHDDSMALAVSVRNAANVEIGTLQIGNVLSAETGSVTQLLFKEGALALAVGARSVVVSLSADKTTGFYNDGYADNLSLRLGGTGFAGYAEVTNAVFDYRPKDYQGAIGILFNTTADTEAVFGAAQFGGGRIAANASIIGSPFADMLTVLVPVNGAVSAAAFAFEAWTPGVDALWLYGDSGGETLTGSSASDFLYGGAGNDTMAGGSGNDVYLAVEAGETVTEAANQGVDRIETALAVYTLPANVEKLVFTSAIGHTGQGNAGHNTINGNAGDDKFLADAGGNDVFSGGSGSDSMDFRLSAAGAQINFAASTFGGAAAGDIFASIEKFFGSNTAGDAMTAGTGRADFSGFGGNDTLTGGISVDKLSGGDGLDTLKGAANDDTLQGGKGNDVMTGGAGRDLFVYVETAASGGWGQDTITDFQDGLDRIKIDSPGVATSIADFTITGNGTSSVLLALAAAPANTILLNGTSAIAIAAADFLFF